MGTRQAAALSAPVAPRTKSVVINLPADQESSGRYVIDFNRPVEIVSLYVSCIRATIVGGALLVPTVDDLLADLTVNEGRRFTGTTKDSDVAQSSGFADLGALHVLTPRVLSIPIRGAGELGLELRWKRFTAGSPFYEGALVAVSALYRFVSEAEFEVLISKLGAD
jgi:hypothetical protein